MSEENPSKKLRLEHPAVVDSRSDDEELWGELCLDDQAMQGIEMIESQALSKPMQTQNDQRVQRTSYCEELEQKLQMKQGEVGKFLLQSTLVPTNKALTKVTNLRMEKDRMNKELKSQLDAKDEIIEKLNKQLRGKQADFEFQIAEMKSQTCRIPKTPKCSKYQQKVTGSSFHERFQFTQKSVVKDVKIFNFGGQLNKGDVLYKLVRRAFNLNEANFSLRIEKGNGFTLFLNCCLLQLCRLTSFDKSVAKNLITLVMSKSLEVLSDFLLELSSSDGKIDRNSANQNAKIVILSKVEKQSGCTNETSLLLTNAKWFSEETAVSVRQTITMLAKLIQIEETLAITIVLKTDKSCENKNSEQTEYISDIIELLDKIVGESTFQKKSKQFEGVYSSILYFCYTFCARYSFNDLVDRHKTRIASVLKKILFSLPGFVAVQYIVDLLNSSARFGLSDYLCHRSAADTFSENLTSFSFSRDTCALQVLSAHTEIIHKSLCFIGAISSWLVNMTTASSRRIKWMRNQTNPKLCECLPTLEQITIKIMLHCVEWSDNPNLTLTENILLNSSIKRCFRILKQFKWQDEQFHIHTANCSIEYEMLLFRLKQVTVGNSTEKFISEEMKTLRSNIKFQPLSTINNQNRLIQSVLGFSPIVDRKFH